jgi:hypothetical protein
MADLSRVKELSSAGSVITALRRAGISTCTDVLLAGETNIMQQANLSLATARVRRHSAVVVHPVQEVGLRARSVHALLFIDAVRAGSHTSRL